MSIRTGVRGVVVGLTLGLIVLMSVQELSAQPRRGQNAPPIETSGVVEAVMPGYIKMSAGENQTWILQVDPKAKVLVTGTAKFDFLKPGHFISFSGEVDKRKSEVVEKVTKLTIMTPSELKLPTALPSQGGGFSGVPGANINQGPAAGAGAKGGPPTERFDIVGQFAGVSKKGKATVVAPNQYFKAAISVEIAEDAEIDVELEDPKAYLLAKKGDKIEAKGSQVAQTGAVVRELTIALTEPLTGVQPGSKKTLSRRTTTKTKKTDDEEEPAEAEKGEKDGEKMEAAAEEEEAKPAKRTSHRTTRKTTKKDEEKEAADDDAADEKMEGAEAEEKDKEDKPAKKVRKAADADEEAEEK